MGAIEHVGETGLKIRLDFPDASLIDAFETEFEVWLRRFEQDEKAHRVALALMAGQEEGGDDTSGYFFTWTLQKKSSKSDIDTIVTAGYSDLITWF